MTATIGHSEQKKAASICSEAAGIKEGAIGIIGALEDEISDLKKNMVISGTDRISGMTFWYGTMNGFSVVLVRCGIGKVNAAMAAQTLAVYYRVAVMINTGVAGALDDRLYVGDIVISTDAVQHDMDAASLGFEKGEIPGLGYLAFSADEELICLAQSSAENAATGQMQVVTGRICSGDQFISGLEKKREIIRAFGGTCCEMEGASIAQVSALNHVPFVIIRAISDKADGTADVSYAEFAEKAAHRSAAIVQDMISRIASA